MLSLLAFIAAPVFVSALHLQSNPGRRHANVTRSLDRRGQEFSFYTGGPVACGGSVSASDTNTVALSHEIWDGGSHCGQTITIHAYGKTKTAVIRDECMGCHSGKVDMIEGLFAWFTGGPTDEVGIFQGSWSFGDSDAEEKEKAQKEKEEKEAEEKKKKEEAAASSSSAAAAKSSSAAAAAKSSSLAAAKSSSLAGAKSSSSVAAQATATSSTAASTTAGASSAQSTAGSSVISNANQLIIEMASIAVAGH